MTGCPSCQWQNLLHTRECEMCGLPLQGVQQSIPSEDKSRSRFANRLADGEPLPNQVCGVTARSLGLMKSAFEFLSADSEEEGLQTALDLSYSIFREATQVFLKTHASQLSQEMPVDAEVEKRALGRAVTHLQRGVALVDRSLASTPVAARELATGLLEIQAGLDLLAYCHQQNRLLGEKLRESPLVTNR